MGSADSHLLDQSRPISSLIFATLHCVRKTIMAKSPIPTTQPLQSRAPLKERYTAVIAIPCCNEFETLPETLKSLESSGAKYLDQTLVIVNVNQRATMDRANNIATLQWLQTCNTPLQLAWQDHVTGDSAYPEKFGVGLARHQACTSGLELIADNCPVISLDADSPVNPEYLPDIFKFLDAHPDFQAGHVNFEHRNCGSESEKQAIRIYEAHLKRHRQKLEEANSPHAWYAIGSTILCTKAAYLKSGGYHCRRMAGEDFYLLQQLSKIGCRIEMLKDPTVYPSDRVSDRVPFGTGKAVSDIIQTGSWLTYHDHCYRDLSQLLVTIEDSLTESATTIFERSPESCVDWLKQRKFSEVWPKLQANARDHQMLLQRFHEWLDAFQTLKLIHHLSEKHYPKVDLARSAERH